MSADPPATTAVTTEQKQQPTQPAPVFKPTEQTTNNMLNDGGRTDQQPDTTGFISSGAVGGGGGTTEYTSLTVDQSRVVEQRVGKPSQHALLFCHFAFKGVATALYLFSGLLGVSFITTFVFVLILLSVDFWLVKNLSGRLLAGLRWWSVTDSETGKMTWKFEAWTPEERQVRTVETTLKET